MVVSVLVVNTVIEVLIVELLILPVELSYAHVEPQNQVFVLQLVLDQVEEWHLLLLVLRVEGAQYN